MFNFAETRSGENVREFLGHDGEHPRKGKLVTDGFSGYKATFERGVTEVGCAAHARRKFHELWANHGSKVGEQALRYFQLLFKIEAEIAGCTPDERRRIRQRNSHRVAAVLHVWLIRQRLQPRARRLDRRHHRFGVSQWGALVLRSAGLRGRLRLLAPPVANCAILKSIILARPPGALIGDLLEQPALHLGGLELCRCTASADT